MSNISCNINAKYINFASNFMVKEKFYSVEGIYVCPHPEKGVLVYSSNRMSFGLFYDENGFASEAFRFIPQKEVISNCKLSKNEKTFSIENDKIYISDDKQQSSFDLILSDEEFQVQTYNELLGRSCDIRLGYDPNMYSFEVISKFTFKGLNNVLHFYSSNNNSRLTFVRNEALPEFTGIMTSMGASDIELDPIPEFARCFVSYKKGDYQENMKAAINLKADSKD